MKTWCFLEVPVSKSKSIFNSLKRREQRQEDKLSLSPGCDSNRTWNVIWEEISEFSPNALKDQNSDNIGKDRYPIYSLLSTISVCTREREESWELRGAGRGRAHLPPSPLQKRGPPALLVTMAGKSRLAFTVAWGFKNSGPMHRTLWFLFPSTAWRVFASLMSWSYGVIESIICSEWLPLRDYKKLQVALVTRELSVILNYWHVFMWYSPKSHAKFSYSSMKSQTQSPPQGKGGI